MAPCLRRDRSRLWRWLSEANPLKMWFLRSAWTEHSSPALVTNPNHKETGFCHFKKLIGFRSSLIGLLNMSSSILIYSLNNYKLLYSPFLLLFPKKTSHLLINSVYIISQGQMQVICEWIVLLLWWLVFVLSVDVDASLWTWMCCSDVKSDVNADVDVCMLICSALHALNRF